MCSILGLLIKYYELMHSDMIYHAITLSRILRHMHLGLLSKKMFDYH